MMTVVIEQVRRGAYHDSVVLMQLQRSLAGLPGVCDAGVVMATEANKDVLAQSDLLTPAVRAAHADDLAIVIRGESQQAATHALEQLDELLSRRRTAQTRAGYRPKSIESAVQMAPEARWVLVSVPGRYAAGVAREALRLQRNVFLYSDNVSLEDEIALKRTAAGQGLLVMGPDCGTAIVNGTGLGFANRVRRGSIGMVAASGTGLQQISCQIDQLGGGISHALGTGGRDLSAAVGGMTARQALDLLIRDAETRVIVLVSKPAAVAVAGNILRLARTARKPVVIDFIGYLRGPVDNLYFVSTFEEAAAVAVELSAAEEHARPAPSTLPGGFAPSQRYLRGLFSGGTLAYEAQLILQDFLPRVASNAPLEKQDKLGNPAASEGHTVVDLGADEFTIGRLHPMIDNDLRIRRLRQEAADPTTAVILLDVVLGFGAHPDPAAELAPPIAEARRQAAADGRHLEVVAVIVGTDEDLQGLESQRERLEEAGAWVTTSNSEAVCRAGRIAQSLDPDAAPPPTEVETPVPLETLHEPLVAVNVGLDSFRTSLEEQGTRAIQVDWRLPAGGDEQLIAILERMKRGKESG
jgi:FdrA protein